jgi:hypothetical protein
MLIMFRKHPGIKNEKKKLGIWDLGNLLRIWEVLSSLFLSLSLTHTLIVRVETEKRKQEQIVEAN